MISLDTFTSWAQISWYLHVMRMSYCFFQFGCLLLPGTAFSLTCSEHVWGGGFSKLHSLRYKNHSDSSILLLLQSVTDHLSPFIRACTSVSSLCFDLHVLIRHCLLSDPLCNPRAPETTHFMLEENTRPSICMCILISVFEMP